MNTWNISSAGLFALVILNCSFGIFRLTNLKQFCGTGAILEGALTLGSMIFDPTTRVLNAVTGIPLTALFAYLSYKNRDDDDDEPRKRRRHLVGYVKSKLPRPTVVKTRPAEAGSRG